MTDEQLDEQHYLTFRVCGEEYGLGIKWVREIIEYASVTTVPMVPPFIKGVLNLRGRVVPVVDLQAKFLQSACVVTKRSCVVIVDVELEGKSTTMGILVDAVCAVLGIDARSIEPPPPLGARIRVDFLKGMAKVEDRFVVLLDIDQVLSIDEIAVLANLNRSSAAAAPEAPRAAAV